MSSSTPDNSRPAVSRHQPVLLRETLTWLDLRPGLVVVDGTVGAGGHSQHILSRIGPTGTLIGLDRDPMMLNFAGAKVRGDNVHLVHSSYARLPQVLESLGRTRVDRVLLDLGLSSDQLSDAGRGFGFEAAGDLDLRFDITQGQPAWQLLETIDEADLERILTDYGEEHFSGAIARNIVRTRSARPIRTPQDLTAAVSAGIPDRFLRDARKHPATRVFQALRIAVNRELEQLESLLSEGLSATLAPGGRAVVISFHSLEDRLVKNAFQDEKRWQNLTSKPVQASAAEERLNPRSRTAKLRAALRTEPAPRTARTTAP
jgi:16S rRNA (cytosine1402-N4)-methyltransferase